MRHLFGMIFLLCSSCHCYHLLAMHLGLPLVFYCKNSIMDHFIYQLLQDEDDDVAQLVFGPYSLVMRRAILHIIIITVVRLLIGSVFEVIKWMRGREKVKEAGNTSPYVLEQSSELALVIGIAIIQGQNNLLLIKYLKVFGNHFNQQNRSSCLQVFYYTTSKIP